MIDVAENPRAVAGDNRPPMTPAEQMEVHVGDLMETAQGFLDGEPITTQAMADMVGKLLADARQAEKDADAQRKLEAKPFDDGKAAVQALWKPILGKCELVTSTAKNALAPFLAAEQARKDAEAAEARRIADAKAAEARAAIQVAAPTDLAAIEQAEVLLKDAKKAARSANRASNEKAMAAGGARSVSLRSVWTAELVNPSEALAHYRKTRPDDLKAWLAEQAQRDVAAGSRKIPGFAITDTKVAV